MSDAARDLLRFIFAESQVDADLEAALQETATLSRLETRKTPLLKALKALDIPTANVVVDEEGYKLTVPDAATWHDIVAKLGSVEAMNVLADEGWVAEFAGDVADTTEPAEYVLNFLCIHTAEPSEQDKATPVDKLNAEVKAGSDTVIPKEQAARDKERRHGVKESVSKRDQARAVERARRNGAESFRSGGPSIAHSAPSDAEAAAFIEGYKAEKAKSSRSKKDEALELPDPLAESFLHVNDPRRGFKGQLDDLTDGQVKTAYAKETKAGRKALIKAAAKRRGITLPALKGEALELSDPDVAEPQLIAVTVKLEDGTSYVTSVNGHATDDSIRRYFVNQTFNRGQADEDKMVKCIGVEIDRAGASPLGESGPQGDDAPWAPGHSFDHLPDVAPVYASKLNPGLRVVIAHDSGVHSNKTGVIVDPAEVKTDGRAIPSNVPGSYSPVNWEREVAVKLDSGELITMFKNRVHAAPANPRSEPKYFESLPAGELPDPAENDEHDQGQPIIVGFEAGADTGKLDWAEFCAANEAMDFAELSNIRDTILRGETYNGAAGAFKVWRINPEGSAPARPLGVLLDKIPPYQPKSASGLPESESTVDCPCPQCGRPSVALDDGNEKTPLKCYNCTMKNKSAPGVIPESDNVFSKHQKKIALSTLKMSDAGARIMGGMTKEEARAFLKKIGYSAERIAKLEGEGTDSRNVERKRRRAAMAEPTDESIGRARRRGITLDESKQPDPVDALLESPDDGARLQKAMADDAETASPEELEAASDVVARLQAGQLDAGGKTVQGAGIKTPWEATDVTNATTLGPIEFQDNQDEWHDFEVLETPERLVFGGAVNTGFLESGFLPKEEGESTDEALQELLADLEVYYNDGPNYVSRIVVNQRM